jgi:ABC-type nickel/cobalt efflux system permease component RcnA
MVGGFGVWLIVKAIKTIKPQKMNITAMRPLSHRHSDDCGCGNHGVGISTQGDWKTRLGVILPLAHAPAAAQS